MSKIITIAEFLQFKEKVRTLQLMKKRAELEQKLKSNAEYQRRSRMTPSERARDAMERMAKNIKLFNDNTRADGVSSYDSALDKARLIAIKADKDNE